MVAGIIDAFDGIREIVYMAKPEDGKLLYLNQSGMEIAGYGKWEQVKGRKYYEAFPGWEHPDALFTGDGLGQEKFLERIYDNPVTGKRYRLKDKLVKWDERLVQLGIAEEIVGGGEWQNAGSARELECEAVVMECIKMMYSSVDTNVAINNTLEKLGMHLCAERTYIFRVHKKSMDNIYEWCAEGVTQEMDSLQNVSLSVIDRWIPEFRQNKCVIIQNLEEIKESAPEEYAILKPQNVQSLITVPLIEQGRFVGYFGVDNPHAGNLNEISNILKMLAYFFQSLLERKRREDYLKKIGFTDGMTGAWNRNAFIRDTMSEGNIELNAIGIFYIDINGLKKMNDTYGHEAGDGLIRQVYQIVCSVMKGFPIYRLGGDEFVVLCANILADRLSDLEEKLREELDGRNGCSAAVGVSYLENPKDLGGLIEEADKRMYKDKRQYYKNEEEKAH